MPSLAGRSHCALARWRIILPSCLDSVTSQHIFRLAHALCSRSFFTENCFLEYCYFIVKNCLGSYINFVVGVHRTFRHYSNLVIRSLRLLQARNTGAVGISWPVLTAIVSVHAAERKVKLVSHIMIALLVTPSLRDNAYSCPRLAIGLIKKNVN